MGLPLNLPGRVRRLLCSGAPDEESRPFRCPIGPSAESGIAGGDDGLAALG